MAQETLEVTLDEKNNVVLHVTTPPERLIEQLAASIEDLTSTEAKSIEQTRASYALIASLISCNLEGVEVTADDLREKYKIAPLVLAAFIATYMDFINDFHNAKN
jgi:hypothetical protein